MKALLGQKAAVEGVFEQFKGTVEEQLDDFKRLAITIDEGGIDEEEAIDELEKVLLIDPYHGAATRQLQELRTRMELMRAQAMEDAIGN